MRDLSIVFAPVQMFFALLLNLVYLIMPYTLRAYYVRFIAFLFHLPFYIFGRLATYLFKKLELDPAKLKE